MVDNLEIQDTKAEKASVEPSAEMAVKPKKKRNWNRIGIVSLLLIVAVTATACAPTDVTTFDPSAESGLCNIYVMVVEWLRIVCGLLSVFSLAYLAAARLASSVLPDIPVRPGTVMIGIVVGLILAGFGEGIAQGLQYSFIGTYVNCSDNLTGPLGSIGI